MAGVLGVFSHWFEIIFIRMFYAMNVSQIHNIVVYSSRHRLINILDRKISYIHWGIIFVQDNLVRHLANPFIIVQFVVDNYNLVLST